MNLCPFADDDCSLSEVDEDGTVFCVLYGENPPPCDLWDYLWDDLDEISSDEYASILDFCKY